MAPEIPPAIDTLFGSVERYAELYKSALLKRREMLVAADKIFQDKLKFSEEDPILPADQLIKLIRSGGIHHDVRTKDKNWVKVVENVPGYIFIALDSSETSWSSGD